MLGAGTKRLSWAPILIAVAAGCGGIDRGEGDGLRFELDREEGVVRIQLAPDSPYESIAFPSKYFGEFTDGDRSWTPDGEYLGRVQDRGRDKRAMRDLRDLVVIREGLTLTVRCRPPRGARLTIDVGSYEPTAEKALHNADVYAWVGALTLF